MSQAALAQACGLSQGAIANYESQNRQTPKKIFKLAEALNVNAVWLAMGTGPMDLASDAETPAHPAYHLADRDRPAQQHLWPFTRLSSEEYWSLSADQRDVVETTLCSLVRSFKDRPAQR